MKHRRMTNELTSLAFSMYGGDYLGYSSSSVNSYLHADCYTHYASLQWLSGDTCTH